LEFTTRPVLGFHAEQEAHFTDGSLSKANYQKHAVNVLLEISPLFTQLSNFSEKHAHFSRQGLAEFIEILVDRMSIHIRSIVSIRCAYPFNIERHLLLGCRLDCIEGIFVMPLTVIPPVLRKPLEKLLLLDVLPLQLFNDTLQG
jgi:hypothetical protein